MAAVPVLGVQPRPTPNYRIVTKYKPAPQPGIPGPYRGRVVVVHSPRCIDEVTEKVDVVLSKNPIDAANEAFLVKGLDSGPAAQGSDEPSSGRLAACRR